MRRKSVLSVLEQNNLMNPNEDLLEEYHILSESDIGIIQQHRGSENRLGFAIQLCYMRYPGVVMPDNPSEKVIDFIADQLGISPEKFDDYGKRKNTIYDHSVELQFIFGFSLFTTTTYIEQLSLLENAALKTDKGIVLATILIGNLRAKKILLPSIAVIERLFIKAITNANRKIYDKLTEKLSESDCKKLDELLKIKPESKFTWLAWVRQSPRKVSTIQILEHIERLKKLQELQFPQKHITSGIHQNRLLKIAREGGQMTSHDLAKFESKRRYATLVAIVIESTATITDEIIDLHDKIIAKLFSVAKNKHRKQFQQSGKSINNQMLLYGKIGQALIDAKQNDTDPFSAIESVISWEDFETSITEVQSLTQPEPFDYLDLMGGHYSTLRRYVPAFLEVLKIQATPSSKDILAGVEILRRLNAENTRKLPDDTPTSFVKKRWKEVVFKGTDIDRHYYELFIPPEHNQNYPALQTMISSEEINVKRIKNNWAEIQRLTVSIQQGTATASLLLRKLSNYPRQNGLALALRELGRIERTLFVLDWLENVDDLRRRVTAGLNKGESRNALARAVFFNRSGEIRDSSYQQQAYRASGLALLTSAIVLWNTVYMERAVKLMIDRGDKFDLKWCQYLSPLGWEHIGLTGDYIWMQENKETT